MRLAAVVNGCDIFCLSEHGLFDEQKHLLETFSDQFVGKIVCSDDNPDFIDGKRGHEGVAIFWKSSINDFVPPLDIKVCTISFE